MYCSKRKFFCKRVAFRPANFKKTTVSGPSQIVSGCWCWIVVLFVILIIETQFSSKWIKFCWQRRCERRTCIYFLCKNNWSHNYINFWIKKLLSCTHNFPTRKSSGKSWKQGVNWLRHGFIIDTSSVVDIQGIARVGGRVGEIYFEKMTKEQFLEQFVRNWCKFNIGRTDKRQLGVLWSVNSLERHLNKTRNCAKTGNDEGVQENFTFQQKSFSLGLQNSKASIVTKNQIEWNSSDSRNSKNFYIYRISSLLELMCLRDYRLNFFQ